MDPGEYPCPVFGSPMETRRGPKGTFLACSAYPRCHTARETDAEGRPIEAPDTGVRCDRCGSPMVLKRGPRGPFLRCSTYPRCRHTKPMSG
jgi:DNA topoisomerase-1